jgi:kanamycin kinase/streptomycin 3"-kinase/aminoglycoside 3'-phosphotransferase-2
VSDRSWEQVVTGRTGADVRRSRDGRAYRKSGVGEVRRELADERDRLLWLAETDLPTASVLDWEDDGDTATLTTSALAGVPLSELPGSSVPGALKSFGLFLQRLHGWPRETCPFDRWLAVTVPSARVRVDEGLVDEDDFDAEREGASAEDLVNRLIDARPRAEELEVGDMVVCHGDACLPNFLVDPESLDVTGMVDVGRLGVADRHLDLALAARSMTDPSLNPAYGPAAAEAMLAVYGLPADPWRLDFYRLLDEFF